MKRLLLTLCLGAAGLTAFSAVTVSRSGRMKAPETCKEIKAPAIGKIADIKKAEAAENTGAVTNPPAGRKQMMLGSSLTFYIFYDQLTQDESYGLAYEGIFCDDGSFYLKNPVSMLDWDTYIKGQVTEEGIEFTFPQPLYTIIDEESGEEPIELMVDVLEYTEVEDPNNPDDYLVTFAPAEDTRTLTFVKGDDGGYMMMGEYMLGVTWHDVWQGYGEMQLYLEPFEAETIEIPANLNYDYSYILADELNGWDHTVLRPLGIAFDGDDVYISGIASGMPDAVVKGSFDRQANTLSIPTNQFMGDYYNHYIFMMTGAGYTYYDDIWEEEMITFDLVDGPLVFNFDPEEKLFTPVVPEGNEYAYIIFNFGNTAAYPCEYYAVDRIYSQGELTDYDPIAPEILGINDISMMDPAYSYSFEFLVWGDNKDGQILRDDCIYYNIFINGELHTFTPYEYPLLAEAGYESLTDIPVYLNVGDDIYASGNYHGIALRDLDIETVGVRTVYIVEGHRGESPIVTVDIEGNPVDGIIETVSAPVTVRTEYFDLFGRRVDGRPNGLVLIERATLSDGTVSVRKLIGK